MVEPRIEDLLSKVDTKYTLVLVAAKRARQINDYISSLHRPDVLKGVPPLVEVESDYPPKPLSIALEELSQEKIGWERPKESAK